LENTTLLAKKNPIVVGYATSLGHIIHYHIMHDY